MRIGVYGGSFNPPHVGHLMVAHWLRWTDRVDAVWWVPVRDHPFSKDLLPFETRVDLCRRAIAGTSWLAVCTIEEELPAPSYTVDTLDALGARFPADRFQLVVGADVLPETDRWKAWDQIEARYAPIVVGRVGWPTPPGAIDFPGVSSTEIRRRAKAGEDLSALVPHAIAEDVARLF